MKTCKECNKEKPLVYRYDTYYIPESKQEKDICEDCLEGLAEAQYEKKCSDFYGGDQPFTQQEKQEAARKLK